MYKIFQLEPYIGKEEIENVTKAINNKWITEGYFTKKMIEKIKEFTNSKHVILTNNGTLALYLALMALGIEEGDEVIVPNFSFIASASSVVFAGGKPVFVDVYNDTGNIDVSKIENVITDKTKAIMPVHIYGQSSDMDPILKIAEKYKLKIVEDAAQGYGVFYKGKHTGTIGDVGTISFFADKTVTMGEGAAILTNNSELFEKICYLRNQGRLHSGTFEHTHLGMNFRVTDLQSAVGFAQLEKFKEIEKIKLSNLSLYKDKLKNVDEVKFLKEEIFTNIVPFRANIKVEKLDMLVDYLENNGIQTRKFFYPLNKQPCFKYLNYKELKFNSTEELNNKGISLPVHCSLKEEDITYICDKIKEFYRGE